MKARVLVALLVCSSLSLSSGAARAQMSEGEKKAAARAAYQEGVQLQDQGKPADALTRFEAAEKLYDAPTHLLHIAECQALLGKLVEASETYESLIRLSLKPDAPEAFVQAQEQARAELPVLRQRIPTMRVLVKPDAQSLPNLAITINDKRMPAELVGIARPVNPGSYRLSAAASGYGTRAPVDVDLKEKEAKTVELVLQQGAAPVVVVPPPPAYGSNGSPAPSDPNAASASSMPDKAAEKAKEKPRPTQTGLLLGAHGGLFAPGGKVAQGTSFDTVGTAGGGLGLDAMFRFGRVFLLGARGEALFLGGPAANTVTAGQTLTSTTNMFGGAVAVGILPNADKVSFYSDLALGYRQLNHSRTQATTKVEQSYSGSYFAISAGLSIPAGPIRIIPKAAIDFGTLSPTDDCLKGACANAATNLAGTISTSSDTSGAYAMFFLGLELMYSIDFGKRPNNASAPGATAASF